jgi:chromosome segregation ATPase
MTAPNDLAAAVEQLRSHANLHTSVKRSCNIVLAALSEAQRDIDQERRRPETYRLDNANLRDRLAAATADRDEWKKAAEIHSSRFNELAHRVEEERRTSTEYQRGLEDGKKLERFEMREQIAATTARAEKAEAHVAQLTERVERYEAEIRLFLHETNGLHVEDCNAYGADDDECQDDPLSPDPYCDCGCLASRKRAREAFASGNEAEVDDGR